MRVFARDFSIDMSAQIVLEIGSNFDIYGAQGLASQCKRGEPSSEFVTLPSGTNVGGASTASVPL